MKEKILSFRNSGVMYYEVNADHRNTLLRSDAFNENAAKLANRERYVGFVTPGMKKRMKKAITLLIQSTPYQYKTHPVTGKTFTHKLSFVTLTTPTHENSYDVKWCHKNMLEPMLRTMRRKWGMKSYIWKCELQENKQVHYHVTCDMIVNHTHLRDEWNKLMSANDMLDSFKLEYGHETPNSTDVHSVYKVNNLESYLVKYICKEYQNEDKLSGKVWDCSKNLKEAKYFNIHIDCPIHDYIRDLQNSMRVVTHYFEKAIFIDFRTTDYYAYFSDKIVNSFSRFLTHVRNGTIGQVYEAIKKKVEHQKDIQWQSKQSTPTKVDALKSQTLSGKLTTLLTDYQTKLFDPELTTYTPSLGML